MSSLYLGVDTQTGDPRPLGPSALALRLALAFSYAITLTLLWIGLLPVAFFSALFSTVSCRRPPAFVRTAFQWSQRVTGFICFLTDAVPSVLKPTQPLHLDFVLEPLPNTPVPRWQPLLGWALVLPQILLLPLICSSLILMVSLSGFSVAFTGTVPPQVHDFVASALIWIAYTAAFILCLTSEFPRFSLEGTPPDNDSLEADSG